MKFSRSENVISLANQCKDQATVDIKIFKDNLARYSTYYNRSDLFGKIKRVAKKAGVKTVYMVLILYYATFDKQLPIKDRLMVVAALGYFILPLDLLPDTLPLGFSDDAAAVVFVLRHIWNNLSEKTFEKARRKLHDWFDDVDESQLANAV